MRRPRRRTRRRPSTHARPYGVAKVYGYWITVNYREAYGMYAANGILFNHESPRRGETFVTRKITRAVARIRPASRTSCIWAISTPSETGATRRSTSKACGGCCRQGRPEDYVLATGVGASVGQFAEAAFQAADLDYRQYVEIDPAHHRPAEVELPAGRCRQGRAATGVEGHHAIGRIGQADRQRRIALLDDRAERPHSAGGQVVRVRATAAARGQFVVWSV